MLKKLHMSLIFSTLVVSNPLSTIIIDMHNFVAKFGKILEICKQFAGNRVNEKGNNPRRGVVPIFSDIEVVALSITAEAFSIDSENNLFNRLNTECPWCHYHPQNPPSVQPASQTDQRSWRGDSPSHCQSYRRRRVCLQH